MVLELHDVEKSFVRGGRKHSAVQGVSLSVNAGELVSIRGKSGSGKTTLLTLIAGLQKPDGGTIRFEGTYLHGLGEQELSRLRNTGIGFVPQGQGLIASLTVRDNVRLPLYVRPHSAAERRAAEERVDALLEQYGIAELSDAYPASLSGGEAHRVQLARALVNRPVLLLADEPTGDLDEATTAAVLQQFRTLADGGTAVILVSHENPAAMASDRRYRMEAGHLLAE